MTRSELMALARQARGALQHLCACLDKMEAEEEVELVIARCTEFLLKSGVPVNESRKEWLAGGDGDPMLLCEFTVDLPPNRLVEIEGRMYGMLADAKIGAEERGLIVTALRSAERQPVEMRD